MEIYKCIHDMITTIEDTQNSENIIRGRDIYGITIFVDKLNLKNNKRLEGARVFNTLFRLSDSSPFKNNYMEMDIDGYVTIFRKFNITCEQWSRFMIFLKQGSVPYYNAYLKNKKLYNTVNANLEELNILCNKLGGIPSFDRFYEKFHKNEIINLNRIYNPNKPTEPNEDDMELYQWASFRNGTSFDHIRFISKYPPHKGWTFVKSVGDHVDGEIYYYCRDWDWVPNPPIHNFHTYYHEDSVN